MLIFLKNNVSVFNKLPVTINSIRSAMAEGSAVADTEAVKKTTGGTKTKLQTKVNQSTARNPFIVHHI